MSSLALRAHGRIVALVFCVAAQGLTGAAQSRRPLTHQDYDAWRTISAPTLSPDGKYLAYAWMPYDGDGDIVVRDLATGKEYREPAGALPPPPVVTPEELMPDEEPPRPRMRIAFTSDSRWLLSNTYPTRAETEKARKDRKKPEDMPTQGLLLLDLATGKASRFERIKSFQVPDKGGAWVAYLKEASPDTQQEVTKPFGTTREPGDAADQAPGAGGSGAGRAPRTEYGTELVLRDLSRSDARERAFQNVLYYTLARDAGHLVYAVSSKSEDENGVYAAVPGSDAPPRTLAAGKGRYQKLAWDRPHRQLAFLSDRDDATAKPSKSRVYYWDRRADQAVALVSDATPGFPSGMVVSDRGSVTFSRDGSRLLVPAGPPPKADDAEGTAPSSDDRVLMDLWHYRDGFVQPMQKVQANRERGRTYTGVWHLAEKKYVQLADADMASVTLADDGRRAFGSDNRPYRRMVDYDGSYQDVYVVDTQTGQRRLALRQQRGGGGGGGFGGGFGGGIAWSPDGKYGAYFRDGNWHLLDTTSLATTNLTEKLPVKFFDEDDDTPDPPSSYGQAQWLRDGASVLLYDRYDVWQVFVDGRAARNLTTGAGRREKMVFRVQRLLFPEEEEEEEARYLDPARPVYLRAESEETRASGFFRTDFAGAAAPQRLHWGDASYQVRAQARHAEVIAISASRFDRFPDLHVTDFGFRTPRKVTDGDPQRQQFTWGTAETIRFRNVDGVPLKGVLYKPDGFDPSKKYPMLVYIYEQLSQGLHNFSNPTPGTSINTAYYVSNGYLVLHPDIVYTTGNPGQSALKCVLPAIDAVVAGGFVDEQAIGIQGHSWGGYQIAYMVTQTTRFKAAEAGAPVGNMTSAYSGIRWGSGLPRQFQYEQTQSRIGQPLYDAPIKFLENSPIFHIARVQTPMLILHNDQDDAVPWYQGIELFLALRRQGKEAYLFNYNGEFHGLRRRHNQRDWTVRMQQFFDHHLKGAPKPAWMDNGVPFIEREEEKERFRKTTAR